MLWWSIAVAFKPSSIPKTKPWNGSKETIRTKVTKSKEFRFVAILYVA